MGSLRRLDLWFLVLSALVCGERVTILSGRSLENDDSNRFARVMMARLPIGIRRFFGIGARISPSWVSQSLAA